ncbi:MAG: hypothetical protein R6V54_07440, partial [Desulfobacteraceae bacterium]
MCGLDTQSDGFYTQLMSDALLPVRQTATAERPSTSPTVSESETSATSAPPDTQALSSPAIALQQLNKAPGLSERKRMLYGTWIQGYLDYLKRECLGAPRPAYVK